MTSQIATLPATAHVSAIRDILRQYRTVPVILRGRIEKHLDAIEAELRKEKGAK
jgi:hypothetical protein